MPRVVWKGAISFGLVHIPVNLYPASNEGRLDLDLLDKRDFAPIGYRRINKRTGKEVASAHIVKGYEYEEGQYVVLTDEDFKRANVKATQTIDIQSFVDSGEVPVHYFATPYYLEPGKRAEKGYVLLRETLDKTGRIGLANVVLRTRQHLAAVMPLDRLLLLVTLRYADEIRSAAELQTAELKGLRISAKELDMATRLVEDMTEAWNPKAYRDTYRDDLMALIARKVKSGKTHEVAPAEAEEGVQRSAQVIDLTAMLKKSLAAQGSKTNAAKGAARAIPLRARSRGSAPRARASGQRRRRA